MRFIILGVFLFLPFLANAEKVRVWYMPDGQVRHTVFADSVDKEKCIDKILKVHPELQGAGYEGIEREEMPDLSREPEVRNRQRETWRKKVGKGVEVDETKVEEIKNEKKIKETAKEKLKSILTEDEIEALWPSGRRNK